MNKISANLTRTLKIIFFYLIFESKFYYCYFQIFTRVTYKSPLNIVVRLQIEKKLKFEFD